ncbi:MAG: LacI family transcriptional regulator [Synergistaceae bacterium]|nr:LacI family transcriptional regulator [Synergistaceae bacterium]
MSGMKTRTTMKDIARAAGVSSVTVHKAIYSKKGVSSETREKILRLAEAMDYSVNAAASSLKRGALHIAVVLQSVSNPVNYFFRSMWAGIDKVERDLLDYRVRITRFECGDDWESQEKILAGVAERKDIDGVVIQCWDETRLNGTIDRLYDLGIPVVTANSDAVGSKRIACVSGPNERIGRLAAELLRGFLPGGGKIVMVGGRPGVEIHNAHRRGFRAFMEETGYSFPIEEVGGDGDPGRVRKNFNRALDGIVNEGGVYAITSRDTLLACREIEERGLADRVRLVGSDVFRELVPFFEQGILRATVWKNQQAQAERAVLALYRHLTGRQAEWDSIGIGVVLRNNLEDYL